MNKYQVFKAGPKKGQPKTLTDRVVRYLVEGRDMAEINSRSKYRQFVQHGYNPNYYFVGKAGAVRTGQVASESVSLTDTVHRMMKMWEARLQVTVDKCNQVLEQAEAEQNINCLDKAIH